jgi:hypothetical protein
LGAKGRYPKSELSKPIFAADLAGARHSEQGQAVKSDASRGTECQMNQSFLVLFFKKEQEKALLFEKRSKYFCSFFLAHQWRHAVESLARSGACAIDFTFRLNPGTAPGAPWP